MEEAWQRALKRFMGPPAVLVGIGNRLRGDDAFGPLLIDRLNGKVPWQAVDVGETPENYIGRILSLEPERVLLLDAVHWSATPGRIGFFPSSQIPWGGISTHAASLRLFAEVLRDQGKCLVAVLGAEPGNTDLGAPLSREMERSVRAVAETLEHLESSKCKRSPPVESLKAERQRTWNHG